MKRWTEREDGVLARNYLRRPADWGGWDALLPGRSEGARTSRAVRIGIRRGRGRKPTVSDEAIVRAVVDHWSEHGYGPTVRELMEVVGLSSTGSMKSRIDGLVEAGALLRAARTPRSLRASQ